MNKRQIEQEIAHSIRIHSRARIRSIKRNGRQLWGANQYNAYYLAAYFKRPIDIGSIIKQASVEINLVD